MPIPDLSALPELARGATAVLHDMGDGRALKLFNPGYSANSARREFQNAQLVRRLGIPTARPYAFIDGDRPAIVYERLDGRTMLDSLFQGDLTQQIAQFAALHREILAYRAQDAPALKDAWRDSAVRGGQSKYLPLIDLLPDGDRLLHGDYHPGNVMHTPNGLYVIDCMDVRSGAPICDVARSVYLMEYTPADLPIAPRRAAVDLYLRAMDVPRAEVERVLPAVMAARLGESIADVEREMLLRALSHIHFI
ncbi:MAG: phosphotransferase family protein [Christensenellales bacterium]|jgi:aminoglycoside phosphotransferase (APT) family kinase protein